MTEPKALKILTSKGDGKKYLEKVKENEKESTYIEVPKRVLTTVNKIQDLPDETKIVLNDIIATAINKRRLEDVSKALENWTNSLVKSYKYPECSANISFSKLLRTVLPQLCPSLTKDEIISFTHFFAKCPHGYEVPFIRAHVELQPVIT